jgi:hypothetical protein
MTEIEQWKSLFLRMRNVAAGYFNLAEENAGTMRRLDKEFSALENEARDLSKVDATPKVV